MTHDERPDQPAATDATPPTETVASGVQSEQAPCGCDDVETTASEKNRVAVMRQHRRQLPN